MDADTRDAVVVGRENFWLGGGSPDQAPEVCSCTACQQSTGAARLHRRQISGFRARSHVAHPINATMNGRELSVLQALPDFTGRQTSDEEL